MIGPETAISFFGIAILLALSPGPDNVFVLTLSATQGRRAGLMVVLGLCTGLVGHTLAVTAGLAALFATSAAAFMVVKLLGAGYLFYLGIQALRAPPASRHAPAQAAPLSARVLYRRGIIMNLSNPKVSLFFLAFLPQFTRPEAGNPGWQSIQLGVLFMLATLIVFGGLAWFAGLIGGYLRRRPAMEGMLNPIAGVVFVGLALRLAFSQRG